MYKRRIRSIYLDIDEWKTKENFELFVAVRENITCKSDTSVLDKKKFKDALHYEDEVNDTYDEDEERIKYFNPLVSHFDIKDKRCCMCIIDENRQIGEHALFLFMLTTKYKWKFKILTTLTDKELSKAFPSMSMLVMLKQNGVIEFITDEEIDEIISDIQSEEEEEIPKSSFIPREYQTHVLRIINEKRDQSIKPIMVKSPCGTGKSWILIEDILTHGENSIILVPLQCLIHQYILNIETQCKNSHKSLPSVSIMSYRSPVTTYNINDKSTRSSGSTRSSESTISSGSSVSTRSNESIGSSKSIKSSVSSVSSVSSENSVSSRSTKSSESSSQKVLIAVYNSFSSKVLMPYFRSKRRIDSFSDYKHIYIDEAHHILMPSSNQQKIDAIRILSKYDEIEEEAINTLSKYDETENSEEDAPSKLDNDEQMRGAYSTLTILYIQKTKKHSVYFSATLEESIAMGGKFANFICPMSMFEAIQRQYLVPLNVLLVSIPKEDKEKNCAKIIKHYGFHSTLVYTLRQSEAKSISNILNHMRIPSKAVVSNPDSTEKMSNDEIFESFRRGDSIRVICTVNCGAEGIDLPIADTAIFFVNKKSIINIIQCVGRIMRQHYESGKQHCQLVLFCDDESNFDDVYVKTLHVLNGDFGYGKTDLRNTIEFRDELPFLTNHKAQMLSKEFLFNLYKYNEKLFHKIDEDGSKIQSRYNDIILGECCGDMRKAIINSRITRREELYIRDHKDELD